MSEIYKIAREMHAAGANHPACINDLRDLWKRAAVGALQCIVVRAGEPAHHLAQDFASSAAHAADALVLEFRKRFVVELPPVADPSKPYDLGEIGRPATFVEVAATDVPIQGLSFVWNEHGLRLSDPRPGRRGCTISWETIEKMRTRFSGWAR